MRPRVVVAGASGVVGSAAVEVFAGEGWDVLALSRRPPIVPQGVRFRHIAVDLDDPAPCRAFAETSGGASHLVYAAVAEEPGLAAGWRNPDLIEKNRRMFANLAEPLAANGALRWACLLQGTKAYGAHLHPISLPAREDAPRDPHVNFYFEQEDCLKELARKHGFSWTILRPQIVFGAAPGAAMNPVAAIGAYAALCRKMGLPFACPGPARAMWEVTDSSLLARAMLWAARNDAAANETFNVTNGDVFVLRDDWDRIGEALRSASAEPRVHGLADLFAGPEAAAAWREIARDNDLVIAELDALLGQSHHYVDMLLDERMAAPGTLPAVVSAIKIRKAGFGECTDSLDSLLSNLRRMCELRLMPPDLICNERSATDGASRKALAGNA